MIERTRPERPPYVPRWVLPSILGILGVAFIAIVALVWLTARAQVDVPNVVGLDESVARVRLAQAGLEMAVGERPFDASAPGTVLEQSPAQGSTLSEGETVVLVVSEGTEEFQMPDVVGMAARIAQAQLEGLGLAVKLETVESEAPSDTVIATNPSAGATVRSSDIVRLSVSQPPDASNALVPFKLSGANVIIDPQAAQGESGDVTMEITRRLRALLEASGATVRVTRTVSATGTTAPVPGAVTTSTTVSAFIGLDVLTNGAGGMAVSTLSATDAGTLYRPSYVLADEVEARLRAVGNTVARETSQDVSLSTAGGPALRVRLGSYESASDASAFSDPGWADKVARALYRAIGERVGSR